MRLHLADRWELMAHWLAGSTVMGTRAVALDYRAWYALASHPLGKGVLTLRYDQFRTREHDILPADPNGEAGHSIALAYLYELTPAVSLVTEVLSVNSTRPGRVLVGDLPGKSERSVTTALRWQF